ncbi:MAG: SUMF1/EgtB/PvdO family nonheme iron enzyme [Deltaproteobacteria bacterium]|jgi:hypothetical protein|nr:SUMF1/EgtB/PvdO family nonheme iron enzyme [Deltaproteobacteria bacterium]
MATIITKDSLRASVEAATGGLVTVLYDDGGHPSFMRRIPRVNIEDVAPELGLTGTHPAFIVDGVEKSELFIGVYPATVVDEFAVSLPGLDPKASINFDQAMNFCRAKGKGWHLMSNIEWALLGALGIKTGFQPNGNTQYGRHHVAIHETATRADNLAPGKAEGVARTLTGSGPMSWRHDNTLAGITDLVGNVWEWASGLRLNEGEIQIIADNNAVTADHGVSSAAWRGILSNGTLAAPGTENTLKCDAAGAEGTGAVKINTVIANKSDGSKSSSSAFSAVTAASGVTIPALLKLLGLFPNSAESLGTMYHINAGERFPLRGGVYNNGALAGLFALALNNARTIANGVIGFRPAFIL